MPAFLLEIGTEEIPASYIRPALKQLAAAFERTLAAEGVRPSGVRAEGTPRRLVLFAADVPAERPGTKKTVRGPAATQAFGPDGKPTPIGAGFAAKHGLPPEAIRIEETPKGRYCRIEASTPGEAAASILGRILPRLVTGLRFPKSMRWVSPSTSFARPIRRLCAVLGDRPIPFEIEGIAAGPKTAGHPFLAPGAIPVPRADLPAFRESLRKSFVILDPDERKSAIESAIHARLGAGNGARIPPDLLEEVAFLVEWPHLLEGRFDEAFLSVPAIVIEQAMTEHQRYFPVHAPGGRLQNRFLVVANRSPADPALIREGNERVLKARLADARYFWETERKTPLESRLPRLEGVLYLQGFGNLRQKADRMAALAKAYADEIPLRPEETEAAVRAAKLAKADLVTDLVGEFPKLQGQMGREFLLAEGEASDVAEAVGEHYRPRFAGDAIPSAAAGRIAALADKFDHLVACFAAGFAPTGSQDPMALRRQTIGIMRILDEGGIPVSLPFAVERAIGALAAQAHPSLAGPNAAAALSDRVLAFLADRVRQHFSDAGFPADHVEAALASESGEIPDIRARLVALRAISARPEWESLVAAVERTGNITRSEKTADAVDPDVFEADEERALGNALLQAAEPVQRFFLAGKYEAGALLYHVSFTAALQRFFQKVFVNVEDARIRANRLAMLSRIHALFARHFADLSRIVVPGKAAPKGGTDA